MSNEKKTGAFARAGRRIAAVTVIAAASLSIIAGSAQAMPKEVWYDCYIPGHGWMVCMDL